MKRMDIIFDTDAGSDCDDMMALGYLIYAQRHLGARIKAITHSLPRPHGAAALRATFRYFGEKAPDIGVMEMDDDAPTDWYVSGVADGFAQPEDRTAAPDAVSVLRRALVECEEKAIICAVGPLSNISALLQSHPDGISPLNGVELVAEKCEKIVTMAGMFVPNDEGVIAAEWNVKCDIPAAQTVAKMSPVPIFWLPYEAGIDMITGKDLVKKYGMTSPIFAAFILFKWGMDGRHSWDPATALYAVERAADRFYVEQGSVTVDDGGITEFYRDQRAAGGVIHIKDHGEGIAEAKKRIAEYLDQAVESVHACVHRA